ncbi:MAG: peptidoglycan D,D-transpeptidase FtsI family protein [Candidatus Aminicenantaceae bacterium]
MNNEPQKIFQKRITILAFFFFLWLVGLVLRLIQIQVINHSRLKNEALNQNRNIDIYSPKRGTIYDRNGKILALSLPVDSVFLTPFENENIQSQIEKINKLKKVLNLSSKEVQRIKSRIEKKDPFIWIKRKITPQQSEKVKELRLTGIFLKEENKRFYPQGRLAAHILGGVSIDESGLSGIEFSHDAILGGKKGKRLILRDAKKRKYRFEVLTAPESGKDMILTIDETIQYIAEKELERAVLERGAKWGLVIISEPSNGEIIALANYPSYDPNKFPPSPIERSRNRAIHHNFEPGSTFKIVTASAALETNRVNLSDKFHCRNGVIHLAGRSILDHKKFDLLSFPEVIQYSSNIGAILIGQRVGEASFYKTIRAFGFGKKTGIDLPGEEKGIFREVRNWSKLSLASLSFGQEISVTAIQMLQALNVIANRGLITNPRVVKKIIISSNEARENTTNHRRIISEATASTMANILERVVQKGTGRKAQIKGFRIAGKTGTAQKFDPIIGTYSSRVHTASFVGFAPVGQPAFSMIVVIDEPKIEYFGGDVAAPLFRKIAQQVLLHLRIFPKKEKSKTFLTAKLNRDLKR